MNSPPIAEFLDMIKETQESSKISTVYRIVKINKEFSEDFVVSDIEIVHNYDDLCVRMVALDVSGWEISEGITSEAQNLITSEAYSLYPTSIFNVVTIRMTRVI